MDDLFEKLCGGLEDEIERQETVLAVCRAQIDAIGARDLNALEARTAALEVLVRDAAHAQAARTSVIAKIAAQLGLPPDRRTLDALAAAAPAPWAGRLRDVQARLHRCMAETRRVVRLNARTVRRSLDFNQRLLACIATGPDRHPIYGERGAAPGIGSGPAVIDQRG